MTLTPGETAPQAVEGTFDARQRHKGAFRIAIGAERRPRRRPKPVLALCALWLGLMIVLAVFASVLPIKDPSTVIGIPNVNPGWNGEFLGTDAIGRSMVSRLVFGVQVSFEISILVTVVAMVIGGAIGLLSAFFRGAVTFVADTIANTILSVPGLLLLLAIVVVFHPSIPVLVGAIALLFLPGFMRVTRATAISLI
jgi:peptide/nickel transport system permease protein